MKLRPAHLIICSVIVFLLDFLILANEAIFPNQEYKGIATVIVLACVLTFVVGMVWAIFKLIFKKTKSRTPIAAASSPVVVPGQSQLALTTLEIVFNRLFAILLVFFSIPLLLNILSLPTIILFIIFGSFLWFGKKYHPFVNIIFLIFALGVYFVPITPIAWGFFRALKEYRLSGFVFIFPVLFLIPQLIFISFSVRNVLGNLLSYFNLGASRRNLLFFVSLLVAVAAVLAYPLFDTVKLRNQSFPAQGSGELGNIVLRQSLTFIDQYHQEDGFTSRIDPSTKKYIYRLRLTKPLTDDIQFTKVMADNEKINFLTDSRVICSSCQKDMGNPYGLVFPADKNIDFIIESDQLIRVIIFTESGDKMDEFTFWE